MATGAQNDIGSSGHTFYMLHLNSQVSHLKEELANEKRSTQALRDQLAKATETIVKLEAQGASTSPARDSDSDSDPDPNHIICRQAIANMKLRMNEALREARDVTALVVKQNQQEYPQFDPELNTQRPIRWPAQWVNGVYTSAQISNRYFRKCQDLAHMEETLELLVEKVEILEHKIAHQNYLSMSLLTMKDVCEALKGLFTNALTMDLLSAEEKPFWEGAKIVFEDAGALFEDLARREPLFSTLYQQFNEVNRTLAAELGTSPAAKILEDVNTTLKELVEWADEQFLAERKDQQEEQEQEQEEQEPVPGHKSLDEVEADDVRVDVRVPMNFSQTSKYVSRLVIAEENMAQALQDYEEKARAAICLGTLANMAEMNTLKILTDRVIALLRGAGFDEHSSQYQTVFAFCPEAVGMPEPKYKMLYGVPRDVLKRAMGLYMKSKALLEPEFWPKFDIAYYSQHFVADLIRNDMDLPWILAIDMKIARFLETIAPVTFDESKRPRFYLSCCFAVRAFFVLEHE